MAFAARACGPQACSSLARRWRCSSNAAMLEFCEAYAMARCRLGVGVESGSAGGGGGGGGLGSGKRTGEGPLGR